MGNSLAACQHQMNPKYEIETNGFNLQELLVNNFIFIKKKKKQERENFLNNRSFKDTMIIPEKLRRIIKFQYNDVTLELQDIKELRNNYGTYQGQVEGSQRHGLGIQDYESSNERYVGEFKGDQISGNGAFIFNNNTIYFGSWKDNTPDGVGSVFTVEGVKICGKWKNGQQFGNGIYITPQFIYTGEIKGQCQNGIGIQKSIDGTVYRGQWLNGMMHGFGILTYNNEQEYEGQFSYNLKDGIGIERNQRNQLTFQGSFTGGLRTGYGIETPIDKNQGLQKAGIWVAGQLEELILTKHEEDEQFQAYKQLNENEPIKSYKICYIQPQEQDFSQLKQRKQQILAQLEDEQFLQEIKLYEQELELSEQYLIEQQQNIPKSLISS